jgi:type IV pilus assembly protein PilM
MIPFLNKFRKREVVGMDLGSAGVKFVRFSRRGDGSIEKVLPEFYPGSVLEEREIPSFREYLRGSGLAGASVACNIDETHLLIRKLDLPQMPEADLKEAVRWQLRDAVEGPVADYAVRYSFLEEAEGKRVSLLAYAVKRAEVDRRVEFLKKVSLHPVLLEPTPVSLAAVFDRLQTGKGDEIYGLLDFGEGRAVLTLIGQGKLYFFRILAGVSGHHLREFLEKELSLPPREAEDLKRSLMSGAASEALSGFYTRIAVEAQKTIDAFFLMLRKDKIHRLFLCGGGGSLKGLGEYLTKNLAIPTDLLDLSAGFPMPEGPSHLYSAALGLALYS